MRQASFLYYGYSRDTYRECSERINATNRQHALMVNLWFIFNNFLYVIFSIMGVFGVSSKNTIFYLSYFVVACVFGIVVLFFRKAVEKNSTAVVYISIVMLMLYGIQTSTAKPYMSATMFPLLTALVAMAYIDNMLRMMLVLAGFSGAFLLSSYSQKAISIAYADTYNIFITLILAGALHYTFQNTRINQFVLYLKNLQNQRELEVSSSFDALTSLLNRGRFFSMADRVIREIGDDYVALCLCDLDGFKQINDKLGHQMGDKAIQLTGTTILNVCEIDESERWSFPERVMREQGSFAGRLGGDEFILIVRGKSSMDEVEDLLNRVLKALNDVWFEGLHGIRASIGVTRIKPGEDIDEVYSRADEALYESKREGKNRIHFSGE